MVQPSQEKDVKELILRILESKYPEGMRSYDLLKEIKKTMTTMSTRTYEKYATELEGERCLERIGDPTDHRAKIIRAVPEYSRKEMLLLEVARRAREIMDSPVPPWENLSGHARFEAEFQEWKRSAQPRLEAQLHKKLTVEQLRIRFLKERHQTDAVGELVKVVHDLYIETNQHMLKEHPTKNPLDIFLGVTSFNDVNGKSIRGIEILHKDDLYRFQRDSSSLDRIRQVAQRSPTLARLLRENGLYIFENSSATR